jgi:hypothetical protein
VFNSSPSVEECDVQDKASLRAYRDKARKWWRWLRDDPHHALWQQICSMILEDVTFRTLVAVAEADRDSVFHSPILARGLLQGYAATQGLFIRRLVDNTRKTISLRRLLADIKNNLRLLTRENYVAGEGLPFDPGPEAQRYLAVVPSMQAHGAFDRLRGISPGPRSRDDRIPQCVINALESWLNTKEIEEVVEWSHMFLAHAADKASYQTVDFAALTPTLDKISAAQRQIVRTAEVVSAYFLRGPIHLSLVPVFQYSQFHRLEIGVRDPNAIKIGEQRWHDLAEERDHWTDSVLDELLSSLPPSL